MIYDEFYFYEKYAKRKTPDPTLDRVRSWKNEIEEMLPENQDLTPETPEIEQICRRFGFYSYHLLDHLTQLNILRKINTNLYRKI